MAETMQSLDQLSALKPAAAPETPRYVQKLDKQGRAYATGKRKDAVARVWVKPGPRDLLAEARLLRLGKRLATGEVTIRSDGEETPVAHVTSTYSIPPNDS